MAAGHVVHVVHVPKPGTMRLVTVRERTENWLATHKGENCSHCGTSYVGCTRLVMGLKSKACCSPCAWVDMHNVETIDNVAP